MKHQKTVEQTVIKFIENHKLLKGSKKILVGFSGGSDSVFALHFFIKFQRKFKIEISAAHVNHCLRESESERDELFCKNFCEKFNVDFYSRKVDVRTHARKYNQSLEEASRELRYNEFHKIAKIIGADKIVTAHNLDDNTETVLLNLLRGTGLKGISGIPRKRDNIIRPFLVVSKKDITNYLTNKKLEFVEDSSNADVEFKRNYLRNSIIPLLRENISRSIDSTIFKSSEIFMNQYLMLDFFISQAFENIVVETKNGILLDLKGLKQFPREILGEVLKRIIENSFNLVFTYDIFTKVNELVSSQVGSIVKISEDIRAVRERGKIFIGASAPMGVAEKKIKVNGEFQIGNKVLSITDVKRKELDFNRTGSVEYVSGDKIKGDLLLRKWRYGDKIKLLGMTGTKMVSDVLTDLKIPSAERQDQYVLEYESDIIWLVGHRINEIYKVKNSTKKILKLCLS